MPPGPAAAGAAADPSCGEIMTILEDLVAGPD
jgi:hypothetical protein